MLWIGLHLPSLSLESFAATLPGLERDTPVALLDAHRISAANGAARRLGIRAGLKRATALALAPRLVLGQADAARDAQGLIAVAHAALAFTPAVVSPASSASTPAAAGGASAWHEVLLEVQASLRYFGGREALLRRLGEALAPLGHRVAMASAPTAMGAALLARDATPGRPQHCAGLDAMRQALTRVPVWRLGPGREHWEALQGMGLRTLSDLRALPRAGLARRFGDGMLDEIDRAWGERPDPRAWLLPAPRFESRLELFARADTSEQVLHGAGVLLARLMAWAAARQVRVRALRLEMQHEPRHRQREDGVELPSRTPLEIELAEPSGDTAHVGSVLRERLGRLRLPAPTLELVLHATELVHRLPPDGELFPSARSEQEGLVRLIERLQARLGPARVQRLVPTPDHRPERACQGEPAVAAAVAAGPAAMRPVHHEADSGRSRPASKVDRHPASPSIAAPVAARASGPDRPAADEAADAGAQKQMTSPVLDLTPAPQASSTAGRTGRPLRPQPPATRNGAPTGRQASAEASTPAARAASAASRPARARSPAPLAPSTPGFASDLATGARRPVWLLPEPQALRERAHRPLLDGEALTLCCGPERIESGWWDGALAERDYYIALTQSGALVWIFRARMPGLDDEGIAGWFLQGRFG